MKLRLKTTVVIAGHNSLVSEQSCGESGAVWEVFQPHSASVCPS